MNLLPAFAVLGLVASTSGAPNYRQFIRQKYTGFENFGSPYGQSQNFFNDFSGQNGQPFNNYQPFNIGRVQVVPNPNGPTGNALDSPPLGITVDFDSSFGSYPLSSRNELTPAQRQTLLPVMESLLRVMESNRPSSSDVNTLMIQVRELLKQVPEGKLPNLRQFGFDVNQLVDDFGIDLETLKNVALPQNGDIVVNENGQDKILTTFGKFPLESLMTKAEREQFLPAVRGFINILKKDVLNPYETKEFLDQVRKLDSWNLFSFDVRGNNEPRKKTGSGSSFNLGALSGLISGLANTQNSGRFF